MLEWLSQFRLHLMRDSLYMLMISCLPRKRFARWIGALAGWQGSNAFSRFLVRLFASHYRIALDEAERPLHLYPNLAEFFVRRLKTGARPIDPTPETIVSPVDGIIAEFGRIDGALCTQVKGKYYSVDELLGNATRGNTYHHGHFLTIYLSPRHYHRIHSPMAGAVVSFHHLPGHLFPVNPPSVCHVDRLFAVNERLITYLKTPSFSGPPLALVKVGAIGVGKIRLCYYDLATNQPDQQESLIEPHPTPVLSKGAELAVFELGSTVVLIFPPDMILDLTLVAGSEIKMGQKIASLKQGDKSQS